MCDGQAFQMKMVENTGRMVYYPAAVILTEVREIGAVRNT